MTTVALAEPKPSVLGLLGELWRAQSLLAKVHGVLGSGQGVSEAQAEELAREIGDLMGESLVEGPGLEPEAIPTDLILEEGEYDLGPETEPTGVWVKVGNIAVRIYRREDGVTVSLYADGTGELDPLERADLFFVEAQALIDLEAERLA